jgi:LmbE family N-acetylglucosaminyl deacetylase
MCKLASRQNGENLRQILSKANLSLMSMLKSGFRAAEGFNHRISTLCLVAISSLALALMPGFPQSTTDTDPAKPLPQDSAVAGLKEMLLRLHTTARLLHTTAHPDDEDGSMLTLESRGEGVTAILLTLNRGEGGQNKVGSNLSDVLGVLRTLELTGSDRYYGVEQRFTTVADFGFSKTADETLEQWKGHDIVLGDLVRVIRTFRPEVLVSRFNGTDRDGHGNHQVSGIISKEAFRDAADPNRFPEQIKEGLLPWQAKKLYIDNVCGFRARECDPKNYTIRLNTGENNSALRMSYAEFAMEGLKHQLSQGAGGWSLDAGPHYAFYKLIDSVLPSTTDSTGHEKDYWDGIDTSLPALAERIASEKSKVPFLRPALEQLQKLVEQATTLADRDPHAAATPLLTGLAEARDLQKRIGDAPISAAGKNAILPDLITKEEQFEKASDLAIGASLNVTVEGPVAPNPEDAFMAVPDQSFMIAAKFTVSNAATKLKEIALDLPSGWTSKLLSEDKAGTAKFRVAVAATAEYTRPYWHRDNPEMQSINIIDDPRYVTLPFPPPPVRAHADYTFNGKKGTVHAVAMTKFTEEGVERERAVAVAPPFSIALEPTTEVISTNHTGSTQINVRIRSNIATAAPASLHLQLPPGWSAEPATQPVTFARAGESKQFHFEVKPADLREARHQIKAVLDYEGKPYSVGYTVITRPDLDTFYYYQPAVQRVSIVDVKVPPGLKVGYIMGAGDDIPTVLQQVGVNVTLIPAEKLASEDLSGYGTIILGIRAYDTQKDLVSNNKKLLDYVSNGGTLMVQYETGVSDFNGGHFTPYSADLSRARVSVEQALVEILSPDDPVFHYPNQITPKDFEGWVQERGLYFMDRWDDHFKPLLSCHDPGEPPQKGGLLIAHYGKGTYIYNAYAFFRQLPAGVPGAIRLYVNLLSAKPQ